MDEGCFNFIYQIPQIFYSSLISGVIGALVKYLALSQKNIIQMKQEKNFKRFLVLEKKIIKILKLKFTTFFILAFFLLLFFTYYITCFCGTYINTQIHLIKDTLISFEISLTYPFGIYLIPGLFRISALRSVKKDSACLYKFSRLIELL